MIGIPKYQRGGGGWFFSSAIFAPQNELKRRRKFLFWERVQLAIYVRATLGPGWLRNYIKGLKSTFVDIFFITPLPPALEPLCLEFFSKNVDFLVPKHIHFK